MKKDPEIASISEKMLDLYIFESKKSPWTENELKRSEIPTTVLKRYFFIL